jgi:hypothetical protein
MGTKYYSGKKIKGGDFMEQQADLYLSVFLGSGVEQK